MKYQVNSRALDRAIFQQGLSVWKAAMASGISTASLTNYLRSNLFVQRATAKRLRDAFGKEVISEVEGDEEAMQDVRTDI